MWTGIEERLRSLGTGGAEPVREQQDRRRCAALPQDLVDQRQGVFGELAAARHDPGGDGRQVLPQDLAVGGQRQDGVSGAGIGYQGGFLVRPQGQQVADFLLGALQPTGLHIALLHGGGHVQENHQRRLVLAQWRGLLSPARAHQDDQ